MTRSILLHASRMIMVDSIMLIVYQSGLFKNLSLVVQWVEKSIYYFGQSLAKISRLRSLCYCDCHIRTLCGRHMFISHFMTYAAAIMNLPTEVVYLMRSSLNCSGFLFKANLEFLCDELGLSRTDVTNKGIKNSISHK